jgi:hypothetical protein
VIGILFGRGAGGQSNYSDSKGDGITNPAPYVNNGSRRAPSNLGHTAQYSDDDGGYLRLKVRAYYVAGAVTLPGAAPPPPTSPSFALAVSPTSLNVRRGKSGTFTVTVTPQDGFASPVSLSASVSPSLRGSLGFGTTTVTPPGSTTLRVGVHKRATPGSYTVTVTGTGGGLTRTAAVTVVVP